jgi:catechol 2,3-dioxygenase-like lactoylglutathione lyase family enzyme
MQLGNFSVCLAVKDLAVSLAFYEKLGFTQVSGDASQHWLVLKNGVARIGLFERHIEKTTLTFNPGWTPDAEPLADFQDVRELQQTLQQRGVTLEVTADPSSTGPAYFILSDPDGNPIFVDQHVPRPGR